ncbi:MAG: hypothetical protein K9N09_11440 [Candidatus Cloacimonetes bacterium]|nr:hypothetical protein [Candidatus Cloacimonadota bacterium]MCF7869297.1 hypothetical protein [Candidatus Cloacimonadota bacterium]MCF7884719.1 hypothetical protein [Candidatus Cloacimonadota bacterium]
MKKILFVIFVSLLLVTCSQHPALKVFSWYSEVAENNYVIPYTLNLFAIDRLENRKSRKHIKKYIEWIFTKLNYPDKHGLTGSIYDFHISQEGEEISSETYDSVDSYSATFLILLNEYVKLTGDQSFIARFKTQIKDIAYTIAHLQDDDGLTSAIPQSDTKYLMDNCEVYGGLIAFTELSKLMGWELENYYDDIAISLRHGIFNYFYNHQNQNFNWAVDDKTVHTSDWNIFYPDAYAQLFPILYKLVDDQPLIKKTIWNNFSEFYSDKENVPLEQQLVISLAEKRMGE